MHLMFAVELIWQLPPDGVKLHYMVINLPAHVSSDYIFLEEFAPNQQFSNPDITIDKQTGNIYVADYFNNRVVKLDSSGNVIIQWGTRALVQDSLLTHKMSELTQSGFVYVVDTRNHRIQKFTENGEFVSQWGSQGSADGQFNFPDRIAIDTNDFIYVTDDGNGRVQKFTTTGTFVSKFGKNHLNVPVGIGTDSNNNVYVAESGGNRISIFTSAGQLIATWGLSGSNPGEFNAPKGLTLDDNDNVYVADEVNNRIQKFDSNGNFLIEFGQDRLNHPIDVAVDSQGRVYASDSNEILIYTPNFSRNCVWFPSVLIILVIYLGINIGVIYDEMQNESS